MHHILTRCLLVADVKKQSSIVVKYKLNVLDLLYINLITFYTSTSLNLLIYQQSDKKIHNKTLFVCKPLIIRLIIAQTDGYLATSLVNT